MPLLKARWLFYFVDTVQATRSAFDCAHRTVQFRMTAFTQLHFTLYTSLFYSLLCLTPSTIFVSTIIPSGLHFRGPLIIKFADATPLILPCISYCAFLSHCHILGPNVPGSPLHPCQLRDSVDSRDQAFGSRKVAAANSGKTRRPAPCRVSPLFPIVALAFCPLKSIYTSPSPLLSSIFCTILSISSIEY